MHRLRDVRLEAQKGSLGLTLAALGALEEAPCLEKLAIEGFNGPLLGMSRELLLEIGESEAAPPSLGSPKQHGGSPKSPTKAPKQNTPKGETKRMKKGSRKKRKGEVSSSEGEDENVMEAMGPSSKKGARQEKKAAGRSMLAGGEERVKQAASAQESTSPLHLPKLATLRVKNCNCRAIAFDTPFLLGLEVESCPALEGLDVASEALLSARMNHCPQLAEIILRKPNQWRRLQSCSMKGCKSIVEENVFAVTGQCPNLKQLELQGTAVASLWSGKQHADAACNKRRRQWQGRGKEPQGAGRVNTRTRAGLDRLQKQFTDLTVAWYGAA